MPGGWSLACQFPNYDCAADRGVPGEAIAEAYDAFEKGKAGSPMMHAALSTQTGQESVKLMLLVRSYQVGDGPSGQLSALPLHCELICCGLPLQVSGHFAAQLDPLGLDKRPPYPTLDPAFYGFTEADMDRE